MPRPDTNIEAIQCNFDALKRRVADCRREQIPVEVDPRQCANARELDTGEPFSWDAPCVTRGYNLGYHEAAAEAAYRDLGSFLRKTFKMN